MMSADPMDSNKSLQRSRYYPASSKGPWVVFFRPKDKPLRTLDISRDLLRRYPGCKVHVESRNSRLRVETPSYTVANKIVDHEVFKLEYFIYIPSRKVEIEGVVSDASLTVEDLKKASGCFRNEIIDATVPIVDVKQLHSSSLQNGKQVYQLSTSFRVTFAGSVLPHLVQIDGALFPVRLYEQRVYNCTNCKKLGHTASHCSNKTRCGKCGENHKEESCTKSAAPQKCAYCAGEPHVLQQCPAFKSRAEKVKRSTKERSKRTYAEMLKSASAVQDTNQFLVLSADEEENVESDSDVSDGGDLTEVHAPSNTEGLSGKKRKCSSPKVRRKVAKVISKGLKNSRGKGEKLNPKTSAEPIPGCSKDFPLPQKKVNKPKKTAFPQTSPNKPKSDGGLFAFSDLVEIILDLFNIQDPLRSIVSALLPMLKPHLKQLTVKWPLIASIISFDD